MPNVLEHLLNAYDCFKRFLWCCFPYYQAIGSLAALNVLLIYVYTNTHGHIKVVNNK